MLEQEVVLEAGQVWVGGGEAVLLVEHEECGCSFIRAVALSPGARQFGLLAFRDADLVEFFTVGQFNLAGTLDAYPGDGVVVAQRAVIQKKMARKFKKKSTKRGKD